MAEMRRWKDLSEKERKVALLAVAGNKDLVIAAECGISTTSVTQWLKMIYRVLGVSNRRELAFEVGKRWKEIGRERRKKKEAGR